MNDDERIVGVAIRSETSGEVVSLPCPNRHNDVIRVLGQRFQEWRSSGYEMGFVTNHGEFVGRRSAKLIAELAGQLLPRASGLPDLYSEDVW